MDLLLVEDKDSFRRLLSQALEGTVWKVQAVADPQEALRALEAQPFQVLVTDLRLPGMSGLELIRRARRLNPRLRVVLMSAFGEPKDIVEAMRLGADDFLPKPFDLQTFLALLDRLRALVGAPPPDPAEPWVAHSPAMQTLESELRQTAASPLSVVFRGERGSGRGRCARRLHVLRHPTAPYLTLPAATLGPEGPDPQTLRLLAGGSLFLSGLEHMSAAASAPLARAMDSEAGGHLAWMGSVDAQGVLAPEIAQRLGSLELRVPPLRERREDLLALTRQLLEQIAKREGRPAVWLERSAERQLLKHDWPGNVRELKNVIERALILDSSDVIGASSLLFDTSLSQIELGSASCISAPTATAKPQEEFSLEAAEREFIIRALKEANWQRTRAAGLLGITRATLHAKLKRYDIQAPGGRQASPSGVQS